MEAIPILIIEPASDLGGVSRYILKIVRHIDRSFRVFFAAPPRGDILKDKTFQDTVVFLPINFRYGVFSFFHNAQRLRKIAKENRIAVVHAHTLRAGLFAAIALWSSPVALIYTPHGLRFLQKDSVFGRRMFLAMDRFIGMRAQAFMALSPKEKEEMVRFHLKKEGEIFIAPACVDIARVQPPAALAVAPPRFDGQFVVGMVGRITEQKDPFGFLAIAEKVKKKIPKAVFVWVGDGALKERFLARVEASGLSSSFIFAGQADHASVFAWIGRFDVFLFTSRYEGLPIVLLEAFSVGVPIVASNVGSISDIIQEGETGFLFSREDYAAACDAVVAATALAPADRDAMARRQRETIRHSYSPESRLTEECEKIYRLVASR